MGPKGATGSPMWPKSAQKPARGRSKIYEKSAPGPQGVPGCPGRSRGYPPDRTKKQQKSQNTTPRCRRACRKIRVAAPLQTLPTRGRGPRYRIVSALSLRLRHVQIYAAMLTESVQFFLISPIWYGTPYHLGDIPNNADGVFKAVLHFTLCALCVHYPLPSSYLTLLPKSLKRGG